MPGVRSTGVVLAVTALLAAPLALPAPAAAAEPLRVALLAPLAAPPGDQATIPADELNRYVGPLGSLGRQLAAYAGTPVALGVDPLVLASMEALGDPAQSPDAAWAAWRARLLAAVNPTFPLGYGDADPALLARADALDLAREPETDWSFDLPALAWPASASVTEDALAALADAGTTILSSDLVAAGSAHARVGGADVLVADAALSSAADAVLTAVGADRLAEARAAFASALASHGGGLVLIALDRHWPVGALNVSTLIAAISLQAGFATVSDLLAAPATEGSLTPPKDPTPTSLVEAMASSLDSDAAFSSVVADPAALVAERRRGLLVRSSAYWAQEDAVWQREVTGYLSDGRRLRGSIEVAPGSDLVALSNSTELPVTVSNSLPVDVTVMVRVRSLRGQLRIEDAVQQLEIPAESSKRATFQAVAVANGRVPVVIELISPTGVRLASPSTLDVDVQGQWEAVFAIVGILLAVLLAAGIVRNIVRRRRLARART